jgi:hypothetical protein
MFNAIGYSTSASSGWKGLQSDVKAMDEWLQRPWCLTEAATTKKDMYGYEAAMQSKNSADNWIRCWDLMQPEEQVRGTNLHLRISRAY